ncbi:PadR family transcriptional regulator [Crossiella sp. NPDC003009]
MTRRSPLAFVVLALLAEEPMHAYRMQQLIKERGKDRVVNVEQRNSIHQALDRLTRDGMVEVAERGSEGNRPNRRVYRITAAGRELFAGWMREMLGAPAREFPEFPAALSFLALFPVAEVAGWLTARAGVLAARLAEPPPAPEGLPRVFLVEEEYLRAMAEAELRWVRGLLAELDAGTLGWDTGALLGRIQ